ncbi:MAG TPA: hypothetical protein VN310_15455 [Candidatus Dormibacteraeota bacterium]|jgi:hypothetical protein|nr:hypothetical protein [Candidatus Dormibacteraeota bacterium]
MSYESESVLPAGASAQAVREFVALLGYEKSGVLKFESTRFEQFNWFDTTAYRSWCGVELSMHLDGQGHVVVHTRTPIARSYYDLIHQNRTISDLQRRFGGRFRTDEGPRRYLKPDTGPPTAAASGCHLAFERFGMNLIKASTCHQAREFPHQPMQTAKALKNFEFLLEIDPRVLANNTLVPFLVAAVEDYFKSTFVALLRYSAKKASFLKGVRLQGDQLLAIADGKNTVEEQVAETLPFQRPAVVCRHFAGLDPGLDLASALRKPYHRRAQSLFDSIDSLILARHDLIHRATLDRTMLDDKVDVIIHDLDAAITRVYRRITEHYGWVFDRGWWIGRGRRRARVPPTG